MNVSAKANTDAAKYSVFDFDAEEPVPVVSAF